MRVWNFAAFGFPGDRYQRRGIKQRPRFGRSHCGRHGIADLQRRRQLQRASADDRHQWRGFLDRVCGQNFGNPNCVVRVLAASREQIVEADFNETLIPPPTISITSPADGGTYLVGTNQALTITVDAEAAPGASIQEVDYYYGTNGVADTPLGVSTQSPFSFIWTNTLWWTNAFVGQYTLSAVAVDDAGAQSDSQSCEHHHCSGLERQRDAGLLAASVFRPFGRGSRLRPGWRTAKESAGLSKWIRSDGLLQREFAHVGTFEAAMTRPEIMIRFSRCR